MARTVDPQRHEARRLHIIDAALTTFAQHGYGGATTAEVCRQAGIGSGTFFHYFPTKIDLMVAILALGTTETRELAGRFDAQANPLTVIREILTHTVTEAADPRATGFLSAVVGVMHEPAVSRALIEDDEAQRDVLHRWVERAQLAGQIRTDVTPERLASWLLVLVNGFIDRVGAEEHFTPEGEVEFLLHFAERMLQN